MESALDCNVYDPQRNRQSDLEPKSEQYQQDANPKSWMRQFPVHRNRLRIVLPGASVNVSINALSVRTDRIISTRLAPAKRRF